MCLCISFKMCPLTNYYLFTTYILCSLFFKIVFIRLNLCHFYDIRIKTLLKLSAFLFWWWQKNIYLFLYNCSQRKIFWFLLWKNCILQNKCVLQKKYAFCRKNAFCKKNAHYFSMNHTVYYYLERSMNSLKIFLIAFIVFACSQRWRKQNDKLHEYLSREPFFKII